MLALTTRAKANLVRRAGAHTVLDRDADDAAGALARAAPHGVDGVADVIGGDPVTALLPTVRDGGRWIVAGALAGAVVSLDLRRLYLHNIRLIGSSMHTPAHFARLAEAARRGTVAPRIAGRYALSEIHAAQRGFQTRTHVGKVVILP